MAFVTVFSDFNSHKWLGHKKDLQPFKTP